MFSSRLIITIRVYWKSAKLMGCYNFFSSFTTVSTCFVIGNISTGCTSTVVYPNPTKCFKSLAKVLGSQDTYTTLSGFASPIASSNLTSHPFLGGSTTITFGLTLSSISLGITSSDLPTQNSELIIPFCLALTFAFSIACSRISTP